MPQQLTVLVWFGAVRCTELWVHRRAASGACFRTRDINHTDKKTCRKYSADNKLQTQLITFKDYGVCLSLLVLKKYILLNCWKQINKISKHFWTQWVQSRFCCGLRLCDAGTVSQKGSSFQPHKDSPTERLEVGELGPSFLLCLCGSWLGVWSVPGWEAHSCCRSLWVHLPKVCNPASGWVLRAPNTIYMRHSLKTCLNPNI